jgi:hypothetical protein
LRRCTYAAFGNEASEKLITYLSNVTFSVAGVKRSQDCACENAPQFEMNAFLAFPCNQRQPSGRDNIKHIMPYATSSVFVLDEHDMILKV